MAQLAGRSDRLDVDVVVRAVARDAGPLAGIEHDARLLPVGREFPAMDFVPGGNGQPIDLETWMAGRYDLAAFDHGVDVLASQRELVLRLVGPADAVVAACGEVATRVQRWACRRNVVSRRPAFDALLALHRKLHAIDVPLVHADFRHALDTWQWVLRLQPAASLALQLAALFHDVERLESEGQPRPEPGAEYDEHKRRHARRGAQIAMQVLSHAGVPSAVCRRTAALIAAHEEPTADPSALTLAEADALSFLSLNSDRYLDHHGAPATRAKIEWTLRRLGPQGQAYLPGIRLRSDVAALMAPVVLVPPPPLAMPPLEMPS